PPDDHPRVPNWRAGAGRRSSRCTPTPGPAAAAATAVDRPLHSTASSPLRSIRSSSFDEGPLGFLSPISHFRTVETLVLRTAARTDWLRCRLSRSSRILCASYSGTGDRHSTSYACILRLSMKPRRCRSEAVSCTAPRIRLFGFRLVTKASLLQGAVRNSFVQLPGRPGQQIGSELAQRIEFFVAHVRALVLAESE